MYVPSSRPLRAGLPAGAALVLGGKGRGRRGGKGIREKRKKKRGGEACEELTVRVGTYGRPYNQHWDHATRSLRHPCDCTSPLWCAWIGIWLINAYRCACIKLLEMNTTDFVGPHFVSGILGYLVSGLRGYIIKYTSWHYAHLHQCARNH